MSAAPDYRINTATAAEIAEHLARCDAQFVPPLSERVHIADYAREITFRAERLEAWAGGRLVGFLAVYCNDLEDHIAFITNVSVVPEWLRRGIAEKLLDDCFTRAAALHMREVHLEVREGNMAAIRLYEKAGFVPGVANRSWLSMTRDLNKRGSE